MAGLHISLNRYFFCSYQTTLEYVREKLSTINGYSNIDLLISSWESIQVNLLNDIITYLQSLNFNSVTVICDPIQRPFANFDNVKYINLTLINTQTNVNPPKWNDSLPQGLLLTGTLEKLNRIGLLNNLYNNGLLTTERLKWSFNLAGVDKERLNNLLYTVKKEEVQRLLDYCQLHAMPSDNAFVNHPLFGQKFTKSADDSSFKEYYSTTSFSVISETHYNPDESQPLVTEKTYRAIAYKHPFIVASTPNTLLLLKNLGFKTYENYLPVPNYDLIVDPDERLDAIVKNIQYFPNVIELYRNEIEKDVEYNFQLIKQIANNEIAKINSIYRSLGLDSSQFYENFELSYTNNKSVTDFIKSEQNLIDRELANNGFLSIKQFNKHTKQIKENFDLNCDIKKYNAIKADSWPEVTSKEDFNGLPQYIKDECINDFNFNVW